MILRFVFILLAALPGFSQEVPPIQEPPLPPIEFLTREIISKQQQLRPIAENYTFTELATSRTWDSKGKIAKEEVKKFEVTRVNGHTVKRLLMKDGHPLSDKELAKEEARLQKESQAALNEEGGESLKKIGFQNILRTSEFTSVKRVISQDTKALSIDFIPKKGMKPTSRPEELLSKLAGNFMVDESTFELIGMTSHLIAPIRIWGGVLGTLAEGATLEHQTSVVNHEIRLPSKLTARFPIKVMFMKMEFESESVFSDYQKFTVEKTSLEK